MKGQLSNAVANELLTKRPEQRYSVSRLSASSQETASTDGPIGLIITGGTIGSEIKNGDLTDTEGKADGAAAESFLLPWNNAAALDAVLTAYEAEVAAVLMEPICINGGGVRPTRDTLDEVRRL